ncbi:MAG: hypothetical protein U5O15_10125 [Candidatus Krumholzibacteriota bacterium]|nr:hypothetical protein [Candidatus Krumholzibacteriota bacterium]
MKKFFKITLAAIMIAAVAVPAMATESRLNALGDVDNYIEDDANIFKWPATLPSYANLVIVDLEAGEGVYGTYGFIYGLGEYGDYGTIGLFFMENTHGPNDIMGGMSLWFNSDVFSSTLDNKYSLVYAYEMDKMALGFKFSRASASMLYDDGTNEMDETQAYTTIGASFRMDINDEMYADIGFDYTMASWTVENDPAEPYGDLSADPGRKMEFNGRLFYEYSETITFIPYIGFTTQEYNLEADDNDLYISGEEMTGIKAMSFDLGMAANFEVNEDNMLIFGIEPFKYMKVEPSVYEDGFNGSFELTGTIMPRFLLALETDVKEWLTVRTGCYKSLGKMKYTYDDGTNEETYEATEAPFDWHLGLAFHVSDFDIDCVLAKETPFVLGNWLTGYDEYDQHVITKMTAVYHF